METDKEQKNSLSKLLDKRAKQILVLSIALITFSFIAPIIFVQNTIIGIDFLKTGPIGDTIGGIMNPFIALAGVFLTFLAFYIQVIANKQQQESFRTELNEQKVQFQKSQFENQFYEMLKLHKENVNDLEIKMIRLLKGVHKPEEITEEYIKGRRVFNYFIKELELCYYIAKENFPDKGFKIWFNKAYGIFFHGLHESQKNTHPFFDELYEVKETHTNNSYSYLKNIINNKYKFHWEYHLNYPIFEGYSSQIAHYLRHLFQTVKFVALQSEDFVSYEEKRKYLRILRAQLSNQEQVMLFYNWFSKFGNQWENEQNKFFTDYRMIHNIYQALLIPDIILEEIFDIEKNYRKEKERIQDSLFEYQDW